MAQRERVSVSALRQVFRSVKRACYAGLDSATLRAEVAHRASDVVPSEAYALSTVDPDTGLLTHVVGSGLSPGMRSDFLRHVYPEWEAELMLKLARSDDPVATLVARRDQGSHASPYHSHAYRQLMRDNGMEAELRAVLCADGGFWGTWCLMRDAPRSRFSDREQLFVRRIAPHIARGLRSAALLEMARESESLELGDHDPDQARPGVLVVDSRDHVSLRNRAAVAQLADLFPDDSPCDEVPLVILQLIGSLRVRLLAGASARPDEVALRLRGHSGHWYTLRACMAEPDSTGEPVCVVVIQMADRRQLGGLLSRLYGLSSREREVLALAARGASTKRIAVQLGISPYTVQDHLGNACDKVGVRGRRALLAKLFFDVTGPLPRA